MSFVIGLILGSAATFAAMYLHAHPEKWQELKDLFKRKPKE